LSRFLQSVVGLPPTTRLPEAVPQHALLPDADDTSRNFGTRKLMQSKKSMKSIRVRRCLDASAASLAFLRSSTAEAIDRAWSDALHEFTDISFVFASQVQASLP
jgi:hypothetical protein